MCKQTIVNLAHLEVTQVVATQCVRANRLHHLVEEAFRHVDVTTVHVDGDVGGRAGAKVQLSDALHLRVVTVVVIQDARVC